MNWALALLAGFAAPLSAPLPLAPATHVARATDIEGLRAEWEGALAAWRAAVEEAKSAGLKRSAYPDHPAVAFWPRLEAAAVAGEGEAALWMLEHAREAGSGISDRRARVQRVLEIALNGGDAPWVGEVAIELAARAREVDRAQLDTLVERLSAPENSLVLRASGMLARAALLGSDEADAASELRLGAVDAVLESDGEVPPRLLEALGRELAQELERANMRHFQVAYEERDGGYVPREDAPPDPREAFAPRIEGLAERGSQYARIWFLSNNWTFDDEQRVLATRYLAELDRSRIDAAALRELMSRVGLLMMQIDPEGVEARFVELVRASPEDEQPGLLMALGEQLGGLDPQEMSFFNSRGLLTAEAAEAARARGIAMLHEVQTRWPDSSAGKNAATVLFRVANLAVGKPAPDFEAADIDGEAFKLSDFKDKVTVVDFWGFW